MSDKNVVELAHEAAAGITEYRRNCDFTRHVFMSVASQCSAIVPEAEYAEIVQEAIESAQRVYGRAVTA